MSVAFQKKEVNEENGLNFKRSNAKQRLHSNAFTACLVLLTRDVQGGVRPKPPCRRNFWKPTLSGEAGPPHRGENF